MGLNGRRLRWYILTMTMATAAVLHPDMLCFLGLQTLRVGPVDGADGEEIGLSSLNHFCDDSSTHFLRLHHQLDTVFELVLSNSILVGSGDNPFLLSSVG